jgi:hypothetical protein
MNIHPLAPASLVAASLMLASCGGGGGGGGIGGTGTGDSGTMRMALTDAPACGFDAVNVTIERVRVHQSAGAAEGADGWQEIVVNPPRRVDLLSLTNGVLEELGETALPAGRYTQMRLVLAGNQGNGPLANSVVPTGGSELPLTTPSGQQSGLKFNIGIDVAADQVADVVLDFDACKSVVARGNGGYNLKPVIAVIPVVSDAGQRVVGTVDPSITAGSATVSVQFNGVPVKSTVPDATGRFVLYPVPAGTYDLVVSASGRVNAVVTGVPVTTTAHTVLATVTPPAATASRTVAGVVTPSSATVRALQKLTNGPSVEVGWAAPNATSGAFSFSLPVDPPLSAAYAAAPTALQFTADTAVGAKYTLEADAAGVIKTQPIDAAVAVPPVSFTFP